MRSAIRFWLFPLLSALLLSAVAPLNAQQIRFYPSFSNPSSPRGSNHLRLNGNTRLASYQSQVVLRLTDDSSQAESSTAYFDLQQQVNQGFTTYFQFQVHNPMTCCSPGDGFAFIIQNSSATDGTMGASGSGLSALGAESGGMGYAGINNSLAVEFDIFGDPWDPNSNHVAIQSCGGNPSVFNTPVHLPGEYTIGNNHDVTSCLLSPSAINTNIPQLGGTCGESGCSDGMVHQVVIQYTPGTPGQLQVWLDPQFIPGTHTPVPGSPTALSEAYNILYDSMTNPLGLKLPANTLWAGFTGSQPAQQGGNRHPGVNQPSGGATIDILSWEFTTHSASMVTQTIPNGGTEADYVFGGHQMGVTYPSDFSNPNGIQMTVEATPVNQQTFYMQRLQGSPFANEQCITYLETGGNCVLYTVTCKDANGNPTMCPPETEENPIAICSKFYTNFPAAINSPDFLKADPIGSNNWCSIFTGFDNNNDPVVSGKGTGFSDIVATFGNNHTGPQCDSGDRLKAITRKLKATVTPASGFCPALN